MSATLLQIIGGKSYLHEEVAINSFLSVFSVFARHREGFRELLPFMTWK